MTYTRRKLEDRIADALESCSSSVKRSGEQSSGQSGGGRWDFSLANGKTLPVTARLSNDWLLLAAPVSDQVTREDLWHLLRLNATLPALSKFVLTARRAVHLRADVPLAEEDDGIDSQDPLYANLATRLSDACSSLKVAFGMLRGEEIGRQSNLPVDAEGQSARQAEELRRICTEAGWPFIERGTGKMMVELDVRESFYQAVVEQRDAGAGVSVEIARFDPLSEPSREALSALLLTTGAQVRMARPSVNEAEAQTVGRFEVIFATPPTASDFKHALSSLSVAAALCGREAMAMRDENIARQYLAIRGVAESPANFSLPAGIDEPH